MVKTRQKVFRKKSRKGSRKGSKRMKGGVIEPITEKRNPHPLLMKFPRPINMAKSVKKSGISGISAKYSLPQSATSAQDDQSPIFKDEIRRRKQQSDSDRDNGTGRWAPEFLKRGDRLKEILHGRAIASKIWEDGEPARAAARQAAARQAAKYHDKKMMERVEALEEKKRQEKFASSLEKMTLGP